MLKNRKNTRVQGDIGLVEAVAWFVKNDYTVSIPISDSQRYDIVVEKSGTLSRVEVKSTYSKAKSGNYTVMVKTWGGNKSGQINKYFSSEDAEILFIVTNDGSKYLIPSSEANKSCITLSGKFTKYKVE